MGVLALAFLCSELVMRNLQACSCAEAAGASLALWSLPECLWRNHQSRLLSFRPPLTFQRRPLKPKDQRLSSLGLSHCEDRPLVSKLRHSTSERVGEERVGVAMAKQTKRGYLVLSRSCLESGAWFQNLVSI